MDEKGDTAQLYAGAGTTAAAAADADAWVRSLAPDELETESRRLKRKVGGDSARDG